MVLVAMEFLIQVQLDRHRKPINIVWKSRSVGKKRGGRGGTRPTCEELSLTISFKRDEVLFFVA